MTEFHIARRELLEGAVAAAGTFLRGGWVLAQPRAELVRAITKDTLWRNRDGESVTWFHPRACIVPGNTGSPTAALSKLARTLWGGIRVTSPKTCLG